MKSICVFTGSSLGNNHLYEQAATALGEALVISGIDLIYGGGRNGLMGVLADTVLKNGGTVTGVITHLLHESEGHNQLTKLHIVETMQERKLMMSGMADGFIVLPGGLGTLEEFFEVWNAVKLKIHNKPIGLLNINNFYTHLLDFIENIVIGGFAISKNQMLIEVSNNPVNLLVTLINKTTNLKTKYDNMFA